MQEINDYSYNNSILNNYCEKVESRIKDLHNNRQVLIGINSIEELNLIKMKITQLFFNIEDDLREIILKLKNSFLQNKEFQDKNILLTNNLRNSEIKNVTLERIKEENKLNCNEFLNQISLLKEKHYQNQEYINFLEEKIKVMQRSSNMKNTIFFDNTSNNHILKDRFLKYNNCFGNEENFNDYNLLMNNDISKLKRKENINDNNHDQKLNQELMIDDFLKNNNIINKDNCNNQFDLVGGFLNNFYKRKNDNIAGTESPNINATANLNLYYETLYNNTTGENKLEPKINNNYNNLGVLNTNDNEKIRKCKTVDYEENEKVN